MIKAVQRTRQTMFFNQKYLLCDSISQVFINESILIVKLYILSVLQKLWQLTNNMGLKWEWTQKGLHLLQNVHGFQDRVRNSRTVMYIDILIINRIPQPVSQTLSTFTYWPTSSTYLINNSFWLVFGEFHKGNFTDAFNAYACIY